MPKRSPLPDMTHTGDTQYERAHARQIAHDLLTAAADALMHGTKAHYPQPPRTDPCTDAITATILNQLASNATGNQ